MKIVIPKYFLGKPIKGSLERVLAGTPQPVQPVQAPQNHPSPASAGINNLGDYIILEGKSHGNYVYGDLIVAKHRLGYHPSNNAINAQIDTARTALGIDQNALQNSAEEQDGTKYIGNMNWNTALSLNQKMGNFTLDPRQFIDFLELLAMGKENKRKVYDGTGKQIDAQELTRIYNEIREVRNPWRSEWLDSSFAANGEKMIMKRSHSLNANNELKVGFEQEISGYVTTDTWIDESSFDTFGLPTKRSSKHTLHYWYPRDGRVAWFGAVSVWAGLDCDWGPSYSNAALGVRAARAKN